MKRFVIIGGGITGLAAAHRLVEHAETSAQAFEFVLLEASPRLGGVVQTEHRDGFLLERGPDSFISDKPAAVELAKRIGLESRLIETNPEHRRSFIVRDGRLRPLPEGFQLMAPSRLWPFITSDIFTWSGKARMALDLLLPARKVNGSADESLASFVRRRLGREALERMAQPMVGGIYTADPEQLSLRATLPRFLEMEQSDRSLILAMLKRGRQQSQEQTSGTSGARYSLFLSFDRGMQLLTDELAARLPPGMARLSSHVERLSFDQSWQQWTVEVQNGQPLTADAVCLTLPAYSAATLLRDTDANLATELEAISYESTATINLAYRRSDIAHPLDGFGFVVPYVEKRSLLACTFSSVKFARRAPEGLVLLRAFVGGALQPEMFALDDDEMLQRVQSDLRDLLRIEGQPLFTSVAKWRRSMPQYHVGHLDRFQRIRERAARLPGLGLAGNAYAGPGIPDCIRSGEAAADAILVQFCQN
jgi:protoporphyrinogen/coproporphyrinogen III oxidase